MACLEKTMQTEKIPCPVCGTPMNHHADKLLYASGDTADTGETIAQLHQCPACGAATSRLERMG